VYFRHGGGSTQFVRKLKKLHRFKRKPQKKVNMIRKREETDNDEIMNVWHEASSLAHPFLESDFVEKVKKDLRDIYIPNTETWVYEDNNTVIGFVSMLGNEIGGLFVLPNNHLKGIGTQLVNFVNELYGELEVEVFEKNAIGRAFYKKYGFVQIKRYYHTESNNDVLRLRYKNRKAGFQ
jgi:putative acetyltransferase